MNKLLVNGEAKAFLLVFAVAGILLGAYTILGTMLLLGDGIVEGVFGAVVLHLISFAATGAGLRASTVIFNGRVGGWWLFTSWAAGVAWFPVGHLVA